MDNKSRTSDRARIRSGPLTAFGEAQAQFDRAAERLRLDAAVSGLLRSPMREYHFAIPVRMDDKTFQVFRGGHVQHNDARGPYRCGVFDRRRSHSAGMP